LKEKTVTTSLIEQTWSSIRGKTQDAIKSHFPVEGRTRSLVLHNIAFDEHEASHDDIRSQEQAKNTGRTWGVPVYGEIGLVDKATGKEIDRAKIRMLTLPKPTTRYSFIVDGSEWQVDNLWKLRSGIYAHEKQNGEFQAEFNLAKAFARSPRLYIPFDPEKKKFKLKYGDTHVPLYSILKTLGVQDEDMKKAWGDDIYKANVEKNTQKKISEFYETLNRNGGVKAKSDSYDDKASAVVDAFHKTELFPDITKVVLGKPARPRQRRGPAAGREPHPRRGQG
jgi:DNA-directed RNA polymerase beta subunit